MKNIFNPLMIVDDDEMEIHPSNSWSEDKYKLVGGYCNIFTQAMRGKWEKLVYIDLYSGPGYTQIKNKILRSSPLIALSLPLPFDIYIFCDENKKYLDSLEKRVLRDYPDKEVYYLNGDSNRLIKEIKSKIPAHSFDNRVLSFCFADPFDLNLEFNTINEISSNRVDLLILQAYYMDANRNYSNYLNEDNEKISKYLGDASWRKHFQNSKHYPNNFVQFLTESYDSSMINLGYLEPDRNSIRIPYKNVKLYYLSFYSKHKLGNYLYKQVQKYADDQLNFGI